jgi:hypothetical protein
MRIFAESGLDSLLDARLQELRQEVYHENRNRLLHMNETETIDYLISNYRAMV